MDEIERKEVVLAVSFQNDVKNIFEYGEETFGINAAKTMVSDVYMRVWNLDLQYLLHPECNFLPTKSKRYRNIIIGSYLIIYRILPQRVEVLKAINSKMSTQKIKAARTIKPI